MSAPTPLLDFFKRGEVARDVRLMVAQGTLAPRAHEQLAILVLLLDDAEPEIRQMADATISHIPVEALKAFLARSDVPIGVREFFAGRGVVPAETPAIEADDPLIDLSEDVVLEGPGGAEGAGATEAAQAAEGAQSAEGEATPPEGADRESVTQLLTKMSFPDRLKAALKGTREMRAILIRDPNKMIAGAVLSSPKLTEAEVEGIAKMASVAEEVLRTIGANRAWMKSYKVVVGLAKNPKTPVAMSMNLLSRLQEKDIAKLAVDRNVPEPLRVAARKRTKAATSKQ